MVRSRAALAVILGVVVAACASSPSLSQPRTALPSGTPAITTVPHVPSPSAVASASPIIVPPASPTHGPLTVEEAGAALFAAERRRVPAEDPLSQKYLSTPCVYSDEPCNTTEMKAGKEYWAALDRALSASKATTVSTFNTRKAAAYDALDTYESNHELHVALGLPEP